MPLLLTLFTLCALTAALISALPVGASGNAGYTTFDQTAQGCLDNPNGVNCNNYSEKDKVYINGGPANGSGLANGTYFFAVLAPGSQNGGFVDGAVGNLSDTTRGATSGDNGSGDPVANRTFTISNGAISTYSGTHRTGITPNGQKIIQLMPYDDTPNPGGVYILAICKQGATSPAQCKYDAFRVKPAATPPPSELQAVNNATPTFTRTYAWGITKSVDQTLVKRSGGQATFNYTVAVTHDGGTDSAWQVTGTIEVVNPNDDPVTGVSVSDVISAGGLADPNATCLVNGGVSSGLSVPGGSALSLAYTCSYSGAPASTDETNTVSVSWPAQTLSPSNGSLGAGGASFSVPISFATPTAVSHGSVDVTDAIDGATSTALGSVSSTDPSPTLFKYSHDFPVVAGTCVDHSNTATFVATDDATVTGSGTEEVTVCGGKDLTVSTTANPTFTRSYNWSIQKSVDKTRVEQLGGSATFNYVVNAAETGFTDSGWQVAATITLSNPNDWQDITGVAVTDVVDNGGTCTVINGTNVTVPKGQSVQLAYSCTYAAAPSPNSGASTATATWDSAAAATPDNSATGTASFAFDNGAAGNPKEVNKTVTVTDTFSNGTPTTLGTLTATSSAPFASASFTYPRTLTVPSVGCQSYTNTGKIVETGQSDMKTVTVCGPAKTGALTMGFWQNKNGQSIISGGASTSGVSNAGTWLRKFAPFQDLSATASPSQVATYVYNVIKAANASGASMNAMLKAQMLATALDVYFSDAALGGNSVAAPAPIGGIAIDLTQICKMTDNTSTGSATCGGSFENVSSAFGRASSLTVSQMLSYAASQSNTGGSTWYLNVKSMQQLAKDAFDAINNQVAFGAS